MLLAAPALLAVARVPLLTRPGPSRPRATVRLDSVLAPPLGAQLLGPLPAGTAIDLDVVLAPRDPSDLAALAGAVATPGSPEFHHYLSAPRLRERFGPSSAVWASVLHALSLAGLSGWRVQDRGFVVGLRSSAAAVERAFSLRLSRGMTVQSLGRASPIGARPVNALCAGSRR